MRAPVVVLAVVVLVTNAPWVGSEAVLPMEPAGSQLSPPPAAELSLRVGVARAGGGYTVTTLPLERYVARVLAGEAGRDSRPAALEALAVAVRTYTLANRGRHRADGFDMCDETHCQVMRVATGTTERAAAATAGRVLLAGGAPASIYYSASCGGRTEIPSAVWPGADDPPYLPSRHDDGCGGAPVWSAELSATDLLRALRAGGYQGARLSNMRVASRNGSGRVARLRFDGLEPAEISGQDLRALVGRTLGWQFIKSTAFELDRRGDRYQFRGHGSGHGVGMCVIGSMRLADAGRSADEILRRYYPGLAIGAPRATPGAPVVDVPRLARAEAASRATPGAVEAAPPESTPPAATVARPAPMPPPAATPTAVAPRAPAAAAPTPAAPTPTPATSTPRPTPLIADVLVSLPDGDEGERGVITDVAVRARADLARALGLPAPRVTLRFHPTVDSYEQATREPWFTSGALVNGEIHLLPPTVLRERGVLERTLRHELVHVMTNATLAGRPLWVREGAAIYFAGTPAVPGAPDARPAESRRAPCPDDAELLRPVSVGALTNAYARAESCFVRDLAKRKSWRDIR
ncbi:MAG: SpoIID/LytB domain-containing protein [Acidobacteriota bacterium]